MDRPGVRQVSVGTGEQGKMEKTGFKIMCGAPTTLAVKGLMMMMMLVMMMMMLMMILSSLDKICAENARSSRRPAAAAKGSTAIHILFNRSFTG